MQQWLRSHFCDILLAYDSTRHRGLGISGFHRVEPWGLYGDIILYIICSYIQFTRDQVNVGCPEHDPPCDPHKLHGGSSHHEHRWVVGAHFVGQIRLWFLTHKSCPAGPHIMSISGFGRSGPHRAPRGRTGPYGAVRGSTGPHGVGAGYRTGREGVQSVRQITPFCWVCSRTVRVRSVRVGSFLKPSHSNPNARKHSPQQPRKDLAPCYGT